MKEDAMEHAFRRSMERSTPEQLRSAVFRCPPGDVLAYAQREAERIGWPRIYAQLARVNGAR